MKALGYIAVITTNINKIDLAKINSGDKNCLLDNITIIAYKGGTTFEVVPRDISGNYLYLAKPINFKIDKIKGFTIQGYSDIFKEQSNVLTYVVLYEIYKDNSFIGYVTAYRDKTGQVHIKNISKEEAYRISKVYVENGFRAFHNAVYVAATLQKSEFIRTYSIEFLRIDLKSTKKSPTIHKIDRKSLNSLEDKEKANKIFSDEQLRLLHKYKAKGLPIEKIANPKLSVKHMKLLMELEGLGVDCRYFAKPDANLSGIMFYVTEAKNGGAKDIMNYIYLDLSLEQLMEVSLGYESHIDYDQYARKEIYPNEMAEIRTRLESEMWSGKLLSDDIISAKLRAEKAKLKGDNNKLINIDNKLNKINELRKNRQNSSN